MEFCLCWPCFIHSPEVRYHLDEDPKTLKVFPIPLHDSSGSTLLYDRLSISPDGKILAATHGSTLQWLCTETGKVLDTADKAHDGISKLKTFPLHFSFIFFLLLLYAILWFSYVEEIIIFFLQTVIQKKNLQGLLACDVTDFLCLKNLIPFIWIWFMNTKSCSPPLSRNQKKKINKTHHVKNYTDISTFIC